MAFINIEAPVKHEQTVQDYIKTNKKFNKEKKIKKFMVCKSDKIRKKRFVGTNFEKREFGPSSRR